MLKQELRLGNFVSTSFLSKKSPIVKINFMNEKGIRYERTDSKNKIFKNKVIDYEFVEPVKLDDCWGKLLGINFNFPRFITKVHEMQNWYFWKKGKKELDISKILIPKQGEIFSEDLSRWENKVINFKSNVGYREILEEADKFDGSYNSIMCPRIRQPLQFHDENKLSGYCSLIEKQCKYKYPMKLSDCKYEKEFMKNPNKFS